MFMCLHVTGSYSKGNKIRKRTLIRNDTSFNGEASKMQLVKWIVIKTRKEVKKMLAIILLRVSIQTFTQRHVHTDHIFLSQPSQGQILFLMNTFSVQYKKIIGRYTYWIRSLYHKKKWFNKFKDMSSCCALLVLLTNATT